MRLSHYLIATEKEPPKDAELISHQLMVRAGLIRKLASGVYIWLPLGMRVLTKVSAIVREEMNRIGALEMLMPNVIPAQLWQETGRWQQYGPELLRLKDRHERDFCFGPTHEEVITDLLRRELKSYHQLPLTLYQIQIKFRDEIRPRFGVMRGREFTMKDAYSFHLDQASLQQTYEAMYGAYQKIFTRLGLKFRAVEADTGSIGGSYSHEFQVLADAGEDIVMYSDGSDYAANIEKAESLAPQSPRPLPQEKLALFDTPWQKHIVDLTHSHGIPANRSVKTMIIKNAKEQYYAFIIRGDHDLNLTKVKKLPFMADEAVFASEAEIRSLFDAGPGSLGPVKCPIPVIVDRDAAVLNDFVCGANQDAKHYQGVNWDRDIENYQVYDIRNVAEGDYGPDGRGLLKQARGIEVGHIFQLGTKYSRAMNLTIQNEQGEDVTVLMGCYGIGVTRVIAAAIEQNHDVRGIIWPREMAPFQVMLVPIGYRQNQAVKAFADALYQELLTAGIEVLLDDRGERPGVSFAECDLLGIPARVVINEKLLLDHKVEYKVRTAVETILCHQNELIDLLTKE